MEYKFKVGDKVKVTWESYKKYLVQSMGCDDAMFVKELTSWGGPAYYLVGGDGNSKGIWKESEIKPFDTPEVNVPSTKVKKPKEHSAQAHTKTMWGLVYKNSNFLDQELFTTRALARQCKQEHKMEFAKVTKVTLTWEN